MWHGWVVAAVFSGAGLGACARNECAALYERGDYPAAVDACGRALSRGSQPGVAAKLAWSLYGAGRGDDARALLARVPSDSALSQLTRATLDWRRGRRDGAAAALARISRLCRDEADSFCATRALLELSALHYTLGNYREALEAANGAAAEPAAVKEPNLKARALLRVFDVLYELGDAESAASVLAAANDLHSWDAITEAYVHIKEANLFSLQNRPALAREANATAVDAAARAKVPIVAWSARLNLVKAAAREGRLDDASEQLRAAEALFPQLPKSGNSELALHYHRALVLHARGEWQKGMSELDAALEQRPQDDWIWELQIERALIARDANQRALARNACRAAIEALERMRSDLVADELKAWLLPARRRPFEVLFQLDSDAGDAMAALETAEWTFSRSFLDAFVAARGAMAGGASATTAIERAAALRDFLPALLRSPVVAQAPLAESMRRIGKRRVLLYFAAGETLWLITVMNQRAALHRLDARLPEIQRLAGALAANPDDVDAAAEMGRILLPAGPVAGDGDLFLVASGPLAGVPFAALRTGGRLAVERWTFHYVPSLTALAWFTAAGPAVGGAPAVFADAKGDLSGARAESLAVGRSLGVPPAVGEQASREAVRGAADAGVLHLAVHGGTGQHGAWLQLGDGDLTGADVLRWKVHPGLVVLASCSSAATRSTEMWGSMGTFFLAAGSRAVVASLWATDDAATRILVERFYLNRGSRHPAEALARAQRSLARAGVPASSWAGFVVLGDAGP